MSLEDEADAFVGDDQALHGDSQIVADLSGNGDTVLRGDESDDDADAEDGMPEDSIDDSQHTFEGHTGWLNMDTSTC